MEKEAFELDQRDVEQVCSSPGYSRMSESSRVEKTKVLKAKVQVCVVWSSRCEHINKHILMIITILHTFLLMAGETFL